MSDAGMLGGHSGQVKHLFTPVSWPGDPAPASRIRADSTLYAGSWRRVSRRSEFSLRARPLDAYPSDLYRMILSMPTPRPRCGIQGGARRTTGQATLTGYRTAPGERPTAPVACCPSQASAVLRQADPRVRLGPGIGRSSSGSGGRLPQQFPAFWWKADIARKTRPLPAAATASVNIPLPRMPGPCSPHRASATGPRSQPLPGFARDRHRPAPATPPDRTPLQRIQPPCAFPASTCTPPRKLPRTPMSSASS